MKASELARKTLDHLRESEWIKGRLGETGPMGHRHCLAGAAICTRIALITNQKIRLDDFTTEWRDLTTSSEWFIWEKTLLEVVSEQYPEYTPPERIMSLNDKFPVEKEDLEALMEKTVVKLEEKGE